MGTRYARNYMSGKLSVSGIERLRRFQSWKTLQSYQYDLGLFGDSFIHGPYWVTALRDLLLGDGYADGGPGYSGFGYIGGDKTFRNKSADIAELDYDLTESDWTATYGSGGHGAACEHLVATASGKVINITVATALSKLDVLWLNVGSGIEYQIDGGGYSTFTDIDHGGTETYLSDFSADVNGWTILQRATSDGNIDSIGGRNDCLRVTSTAGSGRPQVAKTNSFTVDETYTIQAEVYLPSSNATIAQVAFIQGDPSATKVTESIVTATDQWVLVSFEYTPQSGWSGVTQARFSGLNAAGQVFFTVPDGDVYYLRNISIREANTNAVAMSTIDCGNAGSSFQVDLRSTAADTTLLGMVGRTANQNALTIHRCGNTGGNAGFFANSTNWADSAALLKCKGAVIMFATNEHNGNTDPATYETNVETMITSLRTNDPNMDIILACPGTTKYGNASNPKTYTLAQYRDRLLTLADEYNCGFVDFSSIIGDWNDNIVSDGFVDSDEVHPGDIGKYLYSNQFHKVLS